MNNIRTLSQEIHNKFSKLPGSERIASRTAVGGLTKWLVRKKPRAVLEIGAGIGTLTYTTIQTLSRVHSNNSYTIVSTEANEFCLEELRNNLRDSLDKFILIQNIEQLTSRAEKFNFAIIDGGYQQDRGLLDQVTRRIAKGGLIFIEGHRRKQRTNLESILESRPWVGVYIPTIRRSSSAKLLERGYMWDLGYTVYQLEPTISEKLYFQLLNKKAGGIVRLRKILKFIRGEATG